MPDINELIETVAMVLDVDVNTLDPNQDLMKVYAIDSVNKLRLLTNIEEEFNTKLPLPKFLAATSIIKIYQLIQSVKN